MDVDRDMSRHPLTPSQLEDFKQNGFLVVPSFYDVERTLRPIQRAIHSLIGLIIRRHELAIHQAPFDPDCFDSGYQELIAVDRRFGGEVYDAVKQIPAFMYLVADPRHEALLCQIRKTDLAGLASVSYGMRIDNPHEERFRAPWHQEYTGQLRSLDGIGFWIPLQTVTRAMGAVEFCAGSHTEGLFRVRQGDKKNLDKTGAYGQVFADEEEIVSRYPHVAPETQRGDLLLLDFLVVHRSGVNSTSQARWSMQTRYFNFRDPTGMRIGWCGSYAAGKDVRQVHPEIFETEDEHV
jgi:hypothetical protein